MRHFRQYNSLRNIMGRINKLIQMENNFYVSSFYLIPSKKYLILQSYKNFC